MSEGPLLVIQPANGLHFPAADALREAVLSRALQGMWPLSSHSSAPAWHLGTGIWPLAPWAPICVPETFSTDLTPLLCSHPIHDDPYNHSLCSLLTCAPPSPASPPHCAVLECSHICSIDYTAALGLGALLEDAQKQGVSLAFVGLQVGSRSSSSRLPSPGSFLLGPSLTSPSSPHVLQVPVLRVLLAADLQGLRYFSSLEEAGGLGVPSL